MKHFFIATFQKLTKKFVPNNTDDESTVKDAFNHQSGFHEATAVKGPPTYRLEEDSYFMDGKPHGLISEMMMAREVKDKKLEVAVGVKVEPFKPLEQEFAKP